ncbi:MAG: tRNA pseudouridine(38-40) synthase TruA [Akkermansia sp.]|nr:tRNA pseudouridine(38-40) synthase TruA [Akkermansia sp.]
MSRLLFTCAYDGLPYCGWQSQRGGASVQDTIEEAVARILRSPLRISASGRTDAGVHAHAQCFHADVPDTCRMSPENWRAALNAHLPASIRILEVQGVDAEFHARFSAVGKEYEYLISTSAVLSPFLHERVWHLPHEFDVNLLAQALRCYEGEHDFRRFAANRGNEPENPPADFYLRTIYSATMQQEDELLRLRLHGNGFMYRMVRLLVGTAHQVARGRMSLDALCGMLENPLGDKTRYCAPAGGLYLRRVFYT